MKSSLAGGPKHCARPTGSYKDESERASNFKKLIVWRRRKSIYLLMQKSVMNTGSSASKEEPRAQKYKAGKGWEMPLGFWDFTKVGKGRKRAMGLRTSRSGGERGWTCPHTLCWMETGEASVELETPPSKGSWVGGEPLITGIRPSPPATAGPSITDSAWLSSGPTQPQTSEPAGTRLPWDPCAEQSSACVQQRLR